MFPLTTDTTRERNPTGAPLGAELASDSRPGNINDAVYNVRINVSSMTDKSGGMPIAAEAEKVLGEASRDAARATAAVERNISIA
jgi:formiminotetrahydrofolate cyclodeaminase